MCQHKPTCPSITAADCEAAVVVVAHPEQGWCRLCNGVFRFDDTGEILPNGKIIAPHRSAEAMRSVAA